MNIERLYCIHKMIESETTGTRKEFAKKINIGERQLKNQIEELEFFGAVVKYCRKRKTYFYAEAFDFFEKIDYLRVIRTMPNRIIRELLKIFLERKELGSDKE